MSRNRWLVVAAVIVATVSAGVGYLVGNGAVIRRSTGPAVNDPYRHVITIVSGEDAEEGCAGGCPIQGGHLGNLTWRIETTMVNNPQYPDPNALPALQGMVCQTGTWGKGEPDVLGKGGERCTRPFPIETGVRTGVLQVESTPFATKNGALLEIELRVGEQSALMPAMDMVAQTVSASPTW